MKKFNRLRYFIIVLVILTIPTFWTLFRPGYFPMQDDLQAFRLHQMDKCFQDFQFPCRWIPDMGYQYGYPQFNFYSPSVYYLGEVLHLLGIQFIDAVKLLFILGFVLSALTMFLFLQSIFGRLPAFFGALLYTYVPFKAVQVYVRGSLSEFWALVIFPLLFWSSYQLITTHKKKYGIYLALSVALMFLTHNLLSVLIFPALAVWCLILMGIHGKWKLFSWLLAFGFLGFGLACFFILPALFEKEYVHTETLLSGYFDYRQHFVSLQKLFFSNEWGYGSSNLGQTEILNLSTGIMQWIMGAIGVIGGLLLFKKERKLSILVLLIGFLELFSLFMIHQKSSFIWQQVPGIEYLQFPWRFLALSTFFLSILGASAIYFLQKFSKTGLWLGLISVVVAIMLTINFFQPKNWLNISDTEKFSGQSWEKQLTISIFDYLPIYAKFPPNQVAPDLPEILDGDVVVTSYKKGSDFQEGNISGGGVIRLPLFDFPGMKVTMTSSTSGDVPLGVDTGHTTITTEVNHWHDDCRNQEYCLGLITFNTPTDSFPYQTFKAELTDTPIRTIGNSISLVSLILLIGMVLLYTKARHAKN